MSKEFKIKRARREHITKIMEIEESYRLTSILPSQSPEHGFLVSGFDEATYSTFMNSADCFYVGLVKEEVAAFVLAYSSERIGSDEWLNLQVREREKKPFILIKQVSTDRCYKGQGLAKMLYSYLFDEIPDRPFLAAIVLEPRNERSIVFHERLGFDKAFELTPPDGMLRGVWRRPSTNSMELGKEGVRG